jgi:hypothetical protein
MTTAAAVLTIARSQLGTVERPNNRTTYGAWYGLDGNPWCAMFINWCLWKAKVPGFLGPINSFAYTPAAVQMFKRSQLGSWSATPAASDLVFFSFERRSPKGVRLADHIGIVESVAADGKLITIEGNTSPQPGTPSAERNGGGVYRRTRSGAAVLGFGRPRYSS